MVVQWLILFVLVYALNDFFTRRVAAGPMTRGAGGPGGAGRPSGGAGEGRSGPTGGPDGPSDLPGDPTAGPSHPGPQPGS
jgi:hypothetical protein